MSVPAAARVIGLGSVFGKSIRDLRGAALAIGLLTGALMVLGGVLVQGQFPTAASRLELTALSGSLPPVIAGLIGEPISVDRLGGFLSWRIGAVIPVLFSIWSIVVLSVTLAGEAAGGALEVVLAAPVTRRRLALSKAAAFLCALAAAMAIAAALTWLTGELFATLPGDEISLSGALGQFLLYGIEIAVAGGIAFALGPLVGRAAAAGVAGAILFAGYLVDGFSGVLPLMEALRPISWFALTAHHRPLAGAWDWPPVALLAGAGVLLFAAGTFAFERRDLAATIRLPIPGLPRATLGTRGPFGRALGDRLPTALAWGLGTALIGLIFSSSSATFAAAMRTVPAFGQMLQLLFPGIDYTTPGGFLQIGVFSSGVVLFGLAAATAVSGWAADEATGRLEVVLAAPITRTAWVLRSGLGTLAAAPLVAGMMALAVAAGATQVGGDVTTPFVGTLVLGVYMAALTGVGIAVGGLTRPRLAAATVVILTVAFYLIELFATALDLPPWVLDLALSHHLGQPMIGTFDPAGMALCAVLAFGGLAVGTWGLARRDLRG